MTTPPRPTGTGNIDNPGTDNLELAASAQKLADSAPTGSLRHAAARSVAITFATTRNLAEARSALDGIAPAEVRRAALQLFHELSDSAH